MLAHESTVPGPPGGPGKVVKRGKKCLLRRAEMLYLGALSLVWMWVRHVSVLGTLSTRGTI